MNILNEETFTARVPPSRLRSIARNLPAPDASYRTSEMRFDVYRAKDMRDHFWRHPSLRTLAIEARNSYLRYGHRSPLDEFDAKAVIYLIHTSYTEAGVEMEEWFCLRLVPGDGSPYGAGELDLFTLNGKPVDEAMRESSGLDEQTFWGEIISGSRMCGIHPFASKPVSKKIASSISRKHRYTPECFALAHAQFIVDYPKEAKSFKLITAVLRRELIQKSLRLRRGEREYSPLFTPAYQYLNLRDGSPIKLKREAYAYEFPAYWLDAGQLVRVLEDLVANNQVSNKDMRQYLGVSYQSKQAMARMGRLLTTTGQIGDSSLTGEELRQLVDEKVEDRPELKITQMDESNMAFMRILLAAETDLFDQHPELKDYL